MRTTYFKKKDAEELVGFWPEESDDRLVQRAVSWFQPSKANGAKFRRRALKKIRQARMQAVSDAAQEQEAVQQDEPVVGGVLEAPDERRARAEGHTFVFTSAQNNTMLNEGFWTALQTYCAARDAELHVSRFTYNKAAFGKNSVKPGSKEASDGEDLWYDPRIEPFVSDESLEIAEDLIWCGELNVIPTRMNPLSSFSGYTRKASGIIPHAKLAMQSVPTMKSDPAKFLYTTGTVTARNYIQKSSGQLAEFHHVFGALVVEVDERGNWWARQLNADKNGGFYDLDVYYSADGEVWPFNENDGVAAITHGDLHWDKVDHAVLETVFAPGGVVDMLRPELQFFHDTIDFTARNHHNIKDPHFLHEMWVTGGDSVKSEFRSVADFLSNMAYREFSRHVIVVSNHDQAIETWLRNTTAAMDPVNARYWHEMNAYCYQMRESGFKPHVFRQALRSHLSVDFQAQCTFVQEDEKFPILGEIEGGLHGHLGPNGARGNPKNLRTAGKANTAHTHSAGIIEGVYTCGVYGKLDMGYNKGLSSWSHSFIITYPNAKRTICTIRDGRAWRAQ